MLPILHSSLVFVFADKNTVIFYEQCEHPTEEDKRWFPQYAGTNWLDTLHFAMQNFKDESFISQFLSPKLMRDFKLFTIVDNANNDHLEIGAIHNDNGYKKLRESLSAQYNLSNHEPNIQVYDVDIRGDRSLILRYVPHNSIPLAPSHKEVLKHLYRLWGFKVKLEQESNSGEITTIGQCPVDDSRHTIE